MIPTQYNFSIYRGDIFRKEFAFYNIDDQGVKTPIDISGATVKCQCRESSDLNSPLIFEFSVSINANSVTISLTPLQTQAIEAGSYVYDLQIDDVTKLYGKIKLIGDITK